MISWQEEPSCESWSQSTLFFWRSDTFMSLCRENTRVRPLFLSQQLGVSGQQELRDRAGHRPAGERNNSSPTTARRRKQGEHPTRLLEEQLSPSALISNMMSSRFEWTEKQHEREATFVQLHCQWQNTFLPHTALFLCINSAGKWCQQLCYCTDVQSKTFTFFYFLQMESRTRITMSHIFRFTVLWFCCHSLI